MIGIDKPFADRPGGCEAEFAQVKKSGSSDDEPFLNGI